MKSFQCRADIAFLIDGSGSIVLDQNCGFVNWHFVLNFLVSLAQSLQLSSQDARVAVTQFSTVGPFNTTPLVRQEIRFSDHKRLQGFMDDVDSLITGHMNGGTPTTIGLNFSLNEMFQERYGMRRDFRKFPKTLVLMTDGECRDGGNCSLATFRSLKQQYKAQNIRIVGIGIGPNVNVTEMLSIVDPENYRPLSNFSDLYDVRLPLTLGLCDGML